MKKLDIVHILEGRSKDYNNFVHCISLLLFLFRDKWYGLLFSQMFNAKKSNLVLCVLYPNSDVPWLGPIQYLGTKQPTLTADPRVAQQTPGDLFPVGPPRPPSFSSPNNLLWAKETVLQVILTSFSV